MTKKTIALFTTTRAEFAAFKPLIDAIESSSTIDYFLFVGGAHLRPEYGNTIDEIINKGYPIAATFDYLDEQNSAFGLLKSLGNEIHSLAQIFNEFNFDFVCLAGDRYELVPIALSAILFRRPIVHLYGGEITEGVIDDQVRHMLTKAAHLHFTSCDLHSDNVKKMGEEPWRVFTTGELVVDNMASVKIIPKEALYAEFNFSLEKDTLILTYHPVTNHNELLGLQQVKNIFEALNALDVQVMVTAPNIEVGSEAILTYMKSYVEEHEHYRFCESLGFVRYYSFLSYVKCVVGNSSSGILEAPFFKLPSVNVGSRQQGRIRHSSVIDVDYSVAAIKKGILLAFDSTFKESLASMNFALGDGRAAQKMVSIIESIEINDALLNKKLNFIWV